MTSRRFPYLRPLRPLCNLCNLWRVLRPLPLGLLAIALSVAPSAAQGPDRSHPLFRDMIGASLEYRAAANRPADALGNRDEVRSV